MGTSEKVEAYFEEEHIYKDAIRILRNLVLKTDLQETYKWNFPTYTLNNKNVLAICKFKHHFGIWFFNGVFLSDPKNILENAQEGKTIAMRHWKFTSKEEIKPNLATVYIHEAIANEKKGLHLSPQKKQPEQLVIPKLLMDALSVDRIAQKAFDKLSFFKKKEFATYIADAKQERTKISRLDKIIPLIKNGKGLHDKYR